MLLRLKEYDNFMYSRFQKILATIKTSAKSSSESKLVLTSFATTGQTVLFFNQSEPSMSFDAWSNEEKIPVAYQLKLNHCLTLLVDAAFWAIGAIDMEEEEDFPEKDLFRLDLIAFRIEEKSDAQDGLTKQYFNTCDLLHRVCPHNTRLWESLKRLIGSYVTGKDLTAQARDISNFDRIEYLRHLTKYSY